MKNKEFWRTVKFALFSVSAGLIEAGSFALLNEVGAKIKGSPMPYWPCYLIALVLSVIWNFTLNRRYTFQSANNVPKAMLLVLAFYAVFTPASTILGDYLADTCGWNKYAVTGLNMVCNFVLEYLYDRFVVFRKSLDTNDIAARKAEAGTDADSKADRSE